MNRKQCAYTIRMISGETGFGIPNPPGDRDDTLSKFFRTTNGVIDCTYGTYDAQSTDWLSARNWRGMRKFQTDVA